METTAELDTFAKKITAAVRVRHYSELEPLMATICCGANKLALLVDLADRLPSTVFVAFFLCGLPHLNQLTIEEWSALFALCKGRGIAIYQITRFLLAHGEVGETGLRSLCADFSEIEKIEQFTANNYKPGEISFGQSRMNDLIYRDYGISEHEIRAFRSKLGGER